jgi:threonine dehydrogenase-like Zn-dependent dehydrogenase
VFPEQNCSQNDIAGQPLEDQSHSRTATMLAARLVAPRHFRIESLPVPQPGPGEVRVRLQGCGVCGSNLAVWRGQPWTKYPLPPGAPGHEGWGIVDHLGARVRGLRRGQRVAFLSGHGFAEYDLAKATEVVALPAQGEIFPGEALGCALNIFRRSQIRSGAWVAVVGIGFIGALLVELAARAGARVIAISRRPYSLASARRAGAGATLSLEDPRAAIEQVMRLTSGAGCECVIEAAGEQATLDVASELVQVRGRLVIAGYHQDGARRVNMQLWNWRGIDVINAHERDPKIYTSAMSSAAEHIAEGKLDPSPLYTHWFALEKISEAFETLDKRPPGFMKAWLRMAGERTNSGVSSGMLGYADDG